MGGGCKLAIWRIEQRLKYGIRKLRESVLSCFIQSDRLDMCRSRMAQQPFQEHVTHPPGRIESGLVLVFTQYSITIVDHRDT